MRSIRWVLTAVVCASFAVVVLGAGDGNSGPQYSLPERALVFPMTEVVQITPQSTGQPVALFDSQSGAVYRLRGTVSNPSARVYWQLAIPAVEKTSGLLRLQNVPVLGESIGRLTRKTKGKPLSSAHKIDIAIVNDTTFEIRDGETFLVDIITGDTWLFRERTKQDLQIGTWQPIDIFAYGKGNRPYSKMPVTKR